jgi:hypothetical protein
VIFDVVIHRMSDPIFHKLSYYPQCKASCLRWIHIAAFFVLVFPALMPATPSAGETRNPTQQTQTKKARCAEDVKIGDYRFCSGENVLSKEDDSDPGWFEITKNGKRVYCERGIRFSIKGSTREGVALPKPGIDINSDGIPELVVENWSGGAHCCFTYSVFSIGKRFKKIAKIEGMNTGIIFRDIDGDGNYEVILSDWSFAYWETSFAFSPAPKVILRWENGKYVVATDLMRKAPREPKELEKYTREVAEIFTKAEDGTLYGFWGPKLWGYMLDLIYEGNMDQARTLLDMAWPVGRIPGGQLSKTGEFAKEAFFGHFMEHLLRGRYAKEMNPLLHRR